MSQQFAQLTATRHRLVEEMTSLADVAARENRNFSDDEQGRWEYLESQLRDVDDRRRRLRDQDRRSADTRRVFDELEARPPERVPQPTNEDRAFADDMRSMLLEKNPKPVEIRNAGPMILERRDLTVGTDGSKTVAKSVYGRVMEHAVEVSGVLRAGATVLSTTTGEDLVIPKSTASSAADLVSEAQALPDTNPSLGSVTLGAYKFGCLVQVSSELVQDAAVDVVGYVAREAGQAVGAKLAPYLVTGTGSSQPRGVAVDATAGVTGPTGTATSFGSQATAGEGSDLVNSLVGSVSEQYVNTGSPALVSRLATLTAVRNLKSTDGALVGNQFLSGLPYPWVTDAGVAAMGASNKSVLFGDWSRYFVRFAGGLRFERSDDYAFNTDLVSFRAVLRADAALINLDAVKAFVHSAS